MDFLVWYYRSAWREVLKGWRNFLYFWWYFFSVPWLLRTLLAPWHRDLTAYGRGVDLKRFSQALANNLISRGVGFGIRAGEKKPFSKSEARNPNDEKIHNV